MILKLSRILLAALAIGAASTLTISAQEVRIFGQIRERTEIDDRVLRSNAPVDAFHLLRTRLGATATLDSTLTGVVEIQDARTFGASRSVTNGSAPALDLRQGYIEINRIAGLPLDARLGRQVIAYANERVLGRSDWGNFGQSFDGLKVSHGNRSLTLDLFGAALARNPNTTGYRRDVVLLGSWLTWSPGAEITSAQGFLLFDNPQADSIRQNRYTTGVYLSGAAGGFDYEVDIIGQFGDYVRAGDSTRAESMRSIAAYMAGLRLGYTFADLAGLRLGIGYDLLSGQRPNQPETYGAFSTLYGTNHRFYGLIDLIGSLPGSTSGLGLHDMFGQVSINPMVKLKAVLDVHLFTTATDPTEVLASSPNASKTIGSELDLTLIYTASKALNVSGGYSIFDGDRNRAILPGRKTTSWGFVMLTMTI